MIGITRRILDSLLMDLRGTDLTHEVLVTFLAEVCAIVNSRPLVPLSSDPEDPQPLTPSLLLTQKPQCVSGIVDSLDMKDMYRKQWKRVQLLAEMFWKRWKSQYLQLLQNRRKWTDPQRNFTSGDVVLLRDKESPRNVWPMGIILKTHPGQDKLVRKVDVRVVKQGGQVTNYTRPVTELVLLVPREE